jgi:hypothetical protein
MTAVRYFVGLDLGQMADYTALAVMERESVPDDRLPPGWKPPPYALRYLDRYHLGTPYPEVVRRVVEALGKPPLLPAPSAPPTVLLVDNTGVGRGVVDLLRVELRKAEAANKACVQLWPVVITFAGGIRRGDNGSWHVPKKELVTALQLLLQHRRLLTSRSLEHAATLVKELENFRIKITQAMKETFESVLEGLHDDLALAAAMAAWAGELELLGRLQRLRRRRDQEPPGDQFWWGPPPGVSGGYIS